jgi:hypothetical protein
MALFKKAAPSEPALEREHLRFTVKGLEINREWSRVAGFADVLFAGFIRRPGPPDLRQ